MRYNRLFDWDRDGELEPDELRRMNEYLNDDAEEPDEEEEQEDELLMHGIDSDSLAEMDEDERRMTLEDAGLDPDDFDEF